MDDEVSIEVEEYRRTVRAVLRRAGASERDACSQTELLLDGDLRGHSSHGVRRLPVLVERMRNGLIVTDADIRVEWRTDSFASVDGGWGFGATVAEAAVDAVVRRADRTGVAVAAVRRANHIGMLAPHVERIAGAGQVGLALTTSEALVHPWGGSRALVGTNPIGIAVPTTGEPLVVDMSTASVSMGKILDHLGRAQPIPAGWAVDEHGRPTTDAAAATRGAISPFGGSKGYALGVAFEALVAVLTGTGLGTDVRGTLDTTEPTTKGDLFLAVSLERLGLQGTLPALTAYLEQLRASGAGGGAPVSVPGDRSRAVRALRLAEGVPLHRATWAATRALIGPDPLEAPHA
ncbi:Ldh family oxidoreductase [Blastococcus tunisiensis]|uniref:Malate/lactate/ureidoglycolate dehydrogenase, LDH2 family n=1 Tax=Blastococcus tunisiensis TaxID=1798228 RepID=A0A1I1WKS4_9ACTN|nr:Ldh family oxidoreductase [Blastococcus sp. DSM 46838]SFD95775.1 Malate/lactate/ureidoglycolate dehydrogenase, LDH2 family [Blastococcus sp. DSM 46838]